jgi:hypothetical protein
MSRDYRVPVQRIHFRYLFIAHVLTWGAEFPPWQGDEARPIFRLYLRKRLLSRDGDSWSMTRPHLAPRIIISFHNRRIARWRKFAAEKKKSDSAKSRQMRLAFCAMRNRDPSESVIGIILERFLRKKDRRSSAEISRSILETRTHAGRSETHFASGSARLRVPIRYRIAFNFSAGRSFQTCRF